MKDKLIMLIFEDVLKDWLSEEEAWKDL